MIVESHNEYQSNIVMNRIAPLMAVKGRQTNPKILTTRRVSSPVHLSVSYSQVLGAHQMKNDQTDVNGGTDDINGVAMIWCEGTKRGVNCENRDHWRTYGRPIRLWPLDFSHNFREKSQRTARAFY